MESEAGGWRVRQKGVESETVAQCAQNSQKWKQIHKTSFKLRNGLIIGYYM